MEQMNKEEPIIKSESVNPNKKIIIIILSIIGLALIVAAIIVIILVSQEKYDDDDEKEEEKFEYGLNIEELENRTNSEHLGHFTLLKNDSKEYSELKKEDKQALKHLVKAAVILDEIELRIDDIHNINFKNFLEKEIKNNASNTQAVLTKKLFDSQKGISAIDRLSQMVYLVKNHTMPLGKGYYPEDLTVEKFHEIITQMINDNKTEEVKNILNQRSIVEWDKDKKYLKSTDYVIYFKDQFKQIADELIKASEVSTDSDFNEYLKSQADALRTADPELDAEADIKWAKLQDTPLEFTLTRENYEDRMTASIANNEELKKLLNSKSITAIGKDSLGLRVGIVNKNGTDLILKIKDYLPELAEYMPYKDEYKNNLQSEIDINQTMVDADLVILAGWVGAYRGQITLAENLPNDDKLSLKRGGGRRNVYHRQIRKESEMNDELRKKLEDILDPDQIKYYDQEAYHWFVVGHENAHTLGPDTSNSTLGDYRSIIEENKADMASLAFVDKLKELEFYDEEQANKIKVTNIVNFFMKVKPDFTQAHRVRSVMQNYFLFNHSAYYLTDEGKIHINTDIVSNVSYSMLEKIIRIQLDNNITEAEEYYKENFIWNKPMEIIAEKLKKYNNEIHYLIENELADHLLNDKNN